MQATTAPAYPFYTRQADTENYTGWFSPIDRVNTYAPGEFAKAAISLDTTADGRAPHFVATEYGYQDELATEGEFTAALAAAQADITARVAALLTPAPCATPCAAPCRATFQAEYDRLTRQMASCRNSAADFGAHNEISRERTALEMAFDAALEAHDPASYFAARDEDERQAGCYDEERARMDEATESACY